MIMYLKSHTHFCPQVVNAIIHVKQRLRYIACTTSVSKMGLASVVHVSYIRCIAQKVYDLSYL